MIEHLRGLAPGDLIQLSRLYRRSGLGMEGAGRDLALLLTDLDRLGFDVVISLRRKRGRPSNVSRFLARQKELEL